MEQLVSIWFYVPATHVEQVKAAMFAAGAGHIGNYDCCSWQTEGTGQYRPLTGSNPYLGKTNQIETSAEYRVEMVCPLTKANMAVQALQQAHPYEEVAYGVVKLENIT